MPAMVIQAVYNIHYVRIAHYDNNDHYFPIVNTICNVHNVHNDHNDYNIYIVYIFNNAHNVHNAKNCHNIYIVKYKIRYPIQLKIVKWTLFELNVQFRVTI